MDSLRFLIWAWDFSTDTGGGVSLHRLAHELAAWGHEARLTCRYTCPGWLGMPQAERRQAGLDEIVIYPEIVEGNPFRAQRVVRWILNTPGFFGPGYGDGIYGDGDLIMVQSRAYRVSPKYKVAGTLKVWRDYSHFRDFGYCRSGGCYAVRKAAGRKALDKHPVDVLCIDDFGQRGGDAYLIRIFNESQRFICYDHDSMLVTLAALCGCLPLVVSAAGELVSVDIEQARAGLRAQIAESAQDVPRFVDLCRERWAA